jgi:hypothetical protein
VSHEDTLRHAEMQFAPFHVDGSTYKSTIVNASIQHRRQANGRWILEAHTLKHFKRLLLTDTRTNEHRSKTVTSLIYKSTKSLCPFRCFPSPGILGQPKVGPPYVVVICHASRLIMLCGIAFPFAPPPAARRKAIYEEGPMRCICKMHANSRFRSDERHRST